MASASLALSFVGIIIYKTSLSFMAFFYDTTLSAMKDREVRHKGEDVDQVSKANFFWRGIGRAVSTHSQWKDMPCQVRKMIVRL